MTIRGRQLIPNFKPQKLDADFPVPVLHMKFGEGKGNIAYDSSPHGNHGTIHGASWVRGHTGSALSFDGVDDYVSVPG